MDKADGVESFARADIPDPGGGPQPVNRRFIALYTLAQIGAFIGFVPLLGVLLPIKAAALRPDAPSILLSQAAMAGALAAGIAYLVAGTLSDRAQALTGTRRAWIVAGAILTVLSYVAVFMAPTPVTLIAAIVGFQVCFNSLFSPLVAVFADRVPDQQKGLVSAFSGLAYPAASLFAALIIAVALVGEAERFLATGFVMILLLIPFLARERAIRPAAALRRVPQGPGLSLAALADHDFRTAFLSRLMVQTAMALNTLYLLYYLKQHSDVAARLGGLRIEAVLGVLLAASTLAALGAGFAAGLASDRWGGRKRFVTAGALFICGGTALLAAAPAWPGPLLGQVVYGIGVGIFSTADQALIAQVLPTRARIGRDLGVMNIAVTLPQVLGPLAGIVLLGAAGWSLPAVFALAAGLAFGGGLLVQGIRRPL
jgi:MFS family permease